MVGFGQGNKELGEQIAPFMLEMTDNLDHELRVTIASSVVGEPAGRVDLDEWPGSIRENIERSERLQEMVAQMRDVTASTEDIWEIAIDGYVLLMERDESYTVYDEYEISRGRWLMVFERSRLMDDLAHHTFATDRYPGPLTHYGIYCEDHLIDVVTTSTPSIRKLSQQEISERGLSDYE